MAYAYKHDARWARAKIGSNTATAYTASAARNAVALVFGFYRLSATTDCFIAQGGVTINATTSSYPLYIGQEAYMMVDWGIGSVSTSGPGLVPPDNNAGGAVSSAKFTDNYISAIRSTADGTLSATRIDSIV